MNIQGEKTVDAEREFVWRALMNPNVLQAAIPGCKSLEQESQNTYRFAIALKVAAITGEYTGEIKLEDPEEPERYTLVISGSGALGHMNAAVQVKLVSKGQETGQETRPETEQESGQQTILRYSGDAEVGGKVAKVGQRVLSSVANLVTNQFFGSFGKQIKALKEATVVD